MTEEAKLCRNLCDLDQTNCFTMEPALHSVQLCLKLFRLAVLPFGILLLLHTNLGAQSMYLPQDNKHLHFLQRLEILLQRNPELNIASPKTINRREAVFAAGMEDSASGSVHLRLSSVDQYNLNSLLLNNAEYITRARRAKGSVYNNPANFLEVNKERFFFAMNPILGAEYGYEKDNDDPIYHFAGGLTMRAFIGNNLGFYASVVRNEESPPSFVRERIQEFNAVPGATYFKMHDNRYSYNDIRGGVTFNVLRIFNFQVAYDRNFIGNGYRSLFLSDFAGNYLFGKASTRIWKFKYQHIYAPMVQTYGVQQSPPSRIIGGKAMAIHHLSINATKWLNLAFFQALVINSRQQWPYMAPVMYYPISKITSKRPDNDIAGFEFKANIAKRGQLYGQILLDNFDITQVSKGNGWWNNRFGVQVGGKLINLFGVKNLDLQVEMNAVRPYTYSTPDSIGSYSHYNQPLAHPLGANFWEGVGILRYQPHPRITTSLRVIAWEQGMDTASQNFGQNIFKPSESRTAEFGYTIPSGINTSGFNAQFLLGYEMRQNIFLEAALLVRGLTVEKAKAGDANTVIGMIGIRMNMVRKEPNY